ncbi:MAG TPA: glycosyltransferase [Puia sp.]|jgi:glycosyltransferase involved in cell wall biosynthesis
MDNIKVSVIMLTYKQADFIAQAIEGVVRQETDFQWELIIADDNSPDGTKDICLSWSARYPNIRYLRNEPNLGANRNFLQAYDRCRGEYIAICEGDDFWTDAKKLQQQVAILSKNPGFSGCFHDVRTVAADNTLIDVNIIPSDYLHKTRYRRIELCSNNIVPTVSLLFRKLAALPAWLADIKIGDYVLHLLNSGKGDYCRIPVVMASYRVFPNSNYEALNEAAKAAQKVEMLSYVLTDHVFRFRRAEKYLLYSNYKRNLEKSGSRAAGFSDRVKENIREIVETYSKQRWLAERLFLKFRRT